MSIIPTCVFQRMGEEGLGADSETALVRGRRMGESANEGVTSPSLVLIGRGVERRTRPWKLEEGPDATVRCTADAMTADENFPLEPIAYSE